ncbi:unnamed protein product [Ilex paraguariensis]|uniref:Uncharacterized protein n=1 Tax=Ilex paraguariensis TaxID=185542 RepID=A0ABC8TZ73_9AQUA
MVISVSCCVRKLAEQKEEGSLKPLTVSMGGWQTIYEKKRGEIGVTPDEPSLFLFRLSEIRDQIELELFIVAGKIPPFPRLNGMENETFLCKVILENQMNNGCSFHNSIGGRDLQRRYEDIISYFLAKCF